VAGVVSGLQIIDDIRQATDDQMSLDEPVAEVCSIWRVDEASNRWPSNRRSKQIVSLEIRLEPLPCFSGQDIFSSNISTCFAKIKDEITAAFGDYIPITGVKGIPVAFPHLNDTEF